MLQGGPERQGLRPVHWEAAGSIGQRLPRGARNRSHLQGERRESQEGRDKVGHFFRKFFLRRERGLKAGESRVEEGGGGREE